LKTREQVYGLEATDLLRTITMYGAITVEQANKLYPSKVRVIDSLLKQLARQGRIFHDEVYDRYCATKTHALNPDCGMQAAIWILADFIDRIEYHQSGDFPIKINIFAEGELYEVIYVALEQELLINYALSGSEPCKRIVIIEDGSQLQRLEICGTVAYCTVSSMGAVQYYKEAD